MTGAEVRRDAPLVGREQELEAITAALEDATETRSARLVSIVGDAGVGKSRLTAEFLERASDRALVLEGRCLPYGDGITFWPVAEAVRAPGGDRQRGRRQRGAREARLVRRRGGRGRDRAASPPRSGSPRTRIPVEELFWAVRRLLEHLAAERPVVFVVQDVHWAEPTFLELLDHLLQAIDEAPVLLVCPTRPELLEEAPDWGTSERATRIVLDPLDASDSKTMIEALLGGASLEPAVLARIVVAAEGNPLYVEQLLRMLIDEGTLEQRDGGVGRDERPGGAPGTTDDPGAPRVTPRHAGERRAIGDRARLGGRVRLPRGGRRRARAAGRVAPRPASSLRR